MKENLVSIKVSPKVLEFLTRLKTNRVKADIENINAKQSYSYLMELIVRYFKMNHDKYLDLVVLGRENNV